MECCFCDPFKTPPSWIVHNLKKCLKHFLKYWRKKAALNFHIDFIQLLYNTLTEVQEQKWKLSSILGKQLSGKLRWHFPLDFTCHLSSDGRFSIEIEHLKLHYWKRHLNSLHVVVVIVYVNKCNSIIDMFWHIYGMIFSP